ncbi:MAG: PA2779 family protein [bacterium]
MTRTLLRPRCIGVVLGLALVLGCLPSAAMAQPVPSMASAGAERSPRQAAEARVTRLLAEEQVGEALAELGLKPEEVRSRLDRLSDEQLAQLADHLETIQAGQGTVIVLAAVAVILLGMLIYMQIEAA